MVSVEKIEELLTLKQVSILLHLHPNTVRNLTNQGALKAIRVNGRRERRFREADIVQFITNSKVHPEICNNESSEEQPVLVARKILCKECGRPLEEGYLTDRELDIVNILIQRDNGNKGIAEILGMSEQTVKNHFSSMFRKFRVQGRVALVIKLAQQGIIKL